MHHLQTFNEEGNAIYLLSIDYKNANMVLSKLSDNQNLDEYILFRWDKMAGYNKK